MTFNELMAKQNFLTKVVLKEGDKELSKDLKIKIVSSRVKLAKFRKEFDEEVQEVAKGLIPEGYQELAQKSDRTEEETTKLEAMNKQINEEYNAFVIKKGQEEVDYNIELTEDEMNEIIEVNAGNDVEINGTKVDATDFLEILYSLFVA